MRSQRSHFQISAPVSSPREAFPDETAPSSTLSTLPGAQPCASSPPPDTPASGRRLLLLLLAVPCGQGLGWSFSLMSHAWHMSTAPPPKLLKNGENEGLGESSLSDLFPASVSLGCSGGILEPCCCSKVTLRSPDLRPCWAPCVRRTQLCPAGQRAGDPDVLQLAHRPTSQI